MLFGLHGRRGRALVFAFLIASLRAEVGVHTPYLTSLKDGRLEKIQQFFAERDSPLQRHSKLFLRVADQHSLDWRLLPSLAAVESSAGLHYRNNNVFGWNNGRAKFSSVAQGIIIVGHRLANAPIYRAKTTEQKLFVYNPKRKYVRAVLDTMASIQTPSKRPVSQ